MAKQFKNALFINFGGIGDEILFLPTLKAYRETYPYCKVTLALEPRSKSIKSLTDTIDKIITVNIKASGIMKYFNVLFFIFSLWFKNFDIVISSGKNPLVAIILFLSGIKERIGYCSKTDFLLTKKVPLNENQYAGKMYHDLLTPIGITKYQDPQILDASDFILEKNIKKGSFVAIHPGVSKMSISKNIFKCPNPKFWKDLIKGLLNKNKQVVLLGTNDDKDLISEILKDETISNHPNFINYFNRTKNILHMAHIMESSCAVICVDSAPMHVAIASNCKTFAIFGPTNEVKLTPNKNNIEIIKNDCNCRPCLWHKRVNNCENSKCLEISPNDILDKIN